MIGNTICADLLDYLYRDWYHIGKPNFFDDRIFQYMEIRRLPGGETSKELPKGAPSADDRFVISLGQSPKIRTDGVSAILSLLEWRYQLAETALFHRTKLAAAAMLDRALFELWQNKSGNELASEILMFSDEQLTDRAHELAIKSAKKKTSEDKRPFVTSHLVLGKLKNRNLYEDLVTLDGQRVDDDRRDWIQKNFGSEADGKGARNRSTTLRQLELDFDLEQGSLAMYCAEIKPKIADVTISVGETVATFHDYEQDHKKRSRPLLSGGHLEAQIERFDAFGGCTSSSIAMKRKNWGQVSSINCKTSFCTTSSTQITLGGSTIPSKTSRE